MKKTVRMTAIAAGLAAVLVSSACSGSPSGDSGEGQGEAKPDSITYVGWGGTTQDYQLEVFGESFTDDSGVKVVGDSPMDFAKLKGMVDSGNVSWDVVIMTPALANEFCGTLLQELPDSVYEGVDFVDEAQMTDCTVPFYISSFSFVYNADAYPSAPQKIEDFFDVEKYPGTRMLPPEYDIGILELALIADGVAVDELYPLDVDRALAKFDTIRDSIVFAESYGQMEQAMMDDSVDMAISPASRLSYVMRDGGNWKPVWDYTTVPVDQLGIPVGSKHTDTALEFLSSTLLPERQARLSELTTQGSVVAGARPELDEFQQEALVLVDTENRGTVVTIDGSWWGENFSDVTEKFLAWQVG